ncbi:MAG: hypothetical protein K0Q43_664 [Ramlibacter sp.]|jgi:hypothetical protein|nr:hypothetical protein [Ramlibacter sp.]
MRRKAFLACLLAVAGGLVPLDGYAQFTGDLHWNSGKCAKKDPFNDHGSIDCNLFVVEHIEGGALSLNSRSLAMIRFVRIDSSREYVLLQVFSQRSPAALMAGSNKLIDPLLIRIDQKSVRTFSPDVVFIDSKPNGIYQSIPIDKELLADLLAGNRLYVRYSSTTGSEATLNFTLNKLLEVFGKVSAEYDGLADTKGATP